MFNTDIEAGIIGSIVCLLGMAAGALIISSIASVIVVFAFMNARPEFLAFIVFAGFFIYVINSLVWAFATDIGSRTFGGTVTGVLECAAYMEASI